MRWPVPACLALLPEDLDLRNTRGQPSALARLVFVLLLLHCDRNMYAWPSTHTLATLTGSEKTAVSKALRLLVERGAIESVTATIRGKARCVWQVRLASRAVDGQPATQVRVFWPGPQGGESGARTAALRALVAGRIGNRTCVAAVVMLFQFARRPEVRELADEHPACKPQAPNHAWIARVLGTTAYTVRRAKQACIKRGLATQQERGLLVFEDPTRWPEILGCADLSPRQDPPPRSPVQLAPLLRLRSELRARHLPMHGRQR